MIHFVIVSNKKKWKKIFNLKNEEFNFEWDEEFCMFVQTQSSYAKYFSVFRFSNLKKVFIRKGSSERTLVFLGFSAPPLAKTDSAGPCSGAMWPASSTKSPSKTKMSATRTQNRPLFSTAPIWWLASSAPRCEWSTPAAATGTTRSASKNTKDFTNLRWVARPRPLQLVGLLRRSRRPWRRRRRRSHRDRVFGSPGRGASARRPAAGACGFGWWCVNCRKITSRAPWTRFVMSLGVRRISQSATIRAARSGISASGAR